MDTQFNLAQLNIARAHFDRTDPGFQSFVDLVEPVNALADRMPGIVWRLTDESGFGSTDIEAFAGPRMLVNLSLWEDYEGLEDFAFNTVHAKVMGRKAEWFELMERQHLVLWWVPAGHLPSLEEAKAKLEALNQSGPTPSAFNFKHRFGPTGVALQSGAPASV